MFSPTLPIQTSSFSASIAGCPSSDLKGLLTTRIHLAELLDLPTIVTPENCPLTGRVLRVGSFSVLFVDCRLTPVSCLSMLFGIMVTSAVESIFDLLLSCIVTTHGFSASLLTAPKRDTSALSSTTATLA